MLLSVSFSIVIASPSLISVRYCTGVLPVVFLNIRQKWEGFTLHSLASVESELTVLDAVKEMASELLS